MSIGSFRIEARASAGRPTTSDVGRSERNWEDAATGSTAVGRRDFDLQCRVWDVVVTGRRKGSDSMLAGLRLGLALLVGLIGSQNGGYVPISTGILLLVVFLVFAILFRFYKKG
jgi:hypothetical protein